MVPTLLGRRCCRKLVVRTPILLIGLLLSAGTAQADECAIQTIRSYPLTTGYETDRSFKTVDVRVQKVPSGLCQTVISENDGTVSLPCPIDNAFQEILHYDAPDAAPSGTRWRYIHTNGVFLTLNNRVLVSLENLRSAIAAQRYLCRINVGRSPGQLTPGGTIVP